MLLRGKVFWDFCETAVLEVVWNVYKETENFNQHVFACRHIVALLSLLCCERY